MIREIDSQLESIEHKENELPAIRKIIARRTARKLGLPILPKRRNEALKNYPNKDELRKTVAKVMLETNLRRKKFVEVIVDAALIILKIGIGKGTDRFLDL